MRAAGHMGTDRVTVRNLEVIKVDAEENLMMVKGPVPGPAGGYLIIQKVKAAR
jgi:large subunit ribosomal protein L3